MTVNDFFRLAVRRWYIFLIGIACAMTAVVTLNAEPWVYIAHTEFVMVPPKNSGSFHPPEDTEQTLIAFADVVARRFNDEEPTRHLSSPSSTLVGNGFRDGTSVRLANYGTQWQSSFGAPIISVQVAGSSPAEAREMLDQVAARISAVTADIQGKSGAQAASYITAETDPSRITTSEFGPSMTSKLKAGALLVGIALCLSMLVARGVESWLSHQERKRFAADEPLGLKADHPRLDRIDR